MRLPSKSTISAVKQVEVVYVLALPLHPLLRKNTWIKIP